MRGEKQEETVVSSCDPSLSPQVRLQFRPFTLILFVDISPKSCRAFVTSTRLAKWPGMPLVCRHLSIRV